LFLDSLGAPSLFQEPPPARGTTPAGTPRHGTGGTAAVRVGSSRGARTQVLPADAAPPERRARSVSNKMPPGRPRRWLPPQSRSRRPAGTRSRSRSPEELPADAALPARRSRSVTNKAPGPRSDRAAASASASGPAAPAEDILSSAPAASASGSGDYLQDFAAAVETVRAALVTPESVQNVLGGARRDDAGQQVLANAEAVKVLASALDRMASDELERQERLISVIEKRPRQPSQPPTLGLSSPRGSVGVQQAAVAIAAKAAAANAGVASRPAPTTPPQGPKAKSAPHRLPTPPPPLGTAASATPQWPSAPAQTWWSPGWWEAHTSSSSDWDSARRTSASTPFTAKSPIAISDSRS
jgi:hypothetical protein